mmetsp:Transcript_82086/g.129276  ORF Transcript_82086/g.129276 Transcript_82086/m.129276 type:complete len:261 (+) Transcript_82086:492-1274(+)
MQASLVASSSLQPSASVCESTTSSLTPMTSSTLFPDSLTGVVTTRPCSTSFTFTPDSMTGVVTTRTFFTTACSCIKGKGKPLFLAQLLSTHLPSQWSGVFRRFGPEPLIWEFSALLSCSLASEYIFQHEGDEHFTVSPVIRKSNSKLCPALSLTCDDEHVHQSPLATWLKSLGTTSASKKEGRHFKVFALQSPSKRKVIPYVASTYASSFSDKLQTLPSAVSISRSRSSEACTRFALYWHCVNNKIMHMLRFIALKCQYR